VDDPTARFAELVRRPAEEIDGRLDVGALLLAAHAHTPAFRGAELDAFIAHGTERLDELAARCNEPVLAEVSHQLFGVEGFRGNDDDYYDPRNSYLDEVLARRIGIPITLSVVLLEVAKRVGIPLVGVSMPGHFLVRLIGDPPVLLDPFAGGLLLSEAECEARFAAVQGPGVAFDQRYLEPVGAVDILARMLNNLRTIHLSRQDSRNLEWVLRLRGLLPGATLEDRTERAGVLAALGRFDDAAELLEDLAEHAPDERAPSLRSKALGLRARLN
jgi:regulator of sirC expression with transglutaminase-like and TPR domain